MAQETEKCGATCQCLHHKQYAGASFGTVRLRLCSYYCLGLLKITLSCLMGSAVI